MRHSFENAEQMDEQNKRIGEKIRALRLNRGLTQAALAGEAITRNMISLIENGSAAPSLSTLTELSHRLNVPVGYFFASDEKEASLFTKMGMIDEFHQLYLAGEYSACLTRISEVPRADDEILYLTAMCHWNLALDALKNDALLTAATALENANLARRSLYTPEGFLATIEYLQLLIKSAGQKEIPARLSSPSAFPNAHFPAEWFAYMRALTALSSGDVETASAVLASGLVFTKAYLDFLGGCVALANGFPAKAYPLLKKAHASSGTGFFTRYHILTALESTATAESDYKAAYQYSAQKVQLLENFTK